MSEENKTETKAEAGNEVKLNGLYAQKMGMSSVYDENGELVPVTVLKVEPWIVSQLKTNEKDGYEAVQVACGPKKGKNASQAEAKRLKGAGFENGARWVREIRQALPEGIAVGQRVSLESFAKGDLVKITGNTKGRGFSGVVRRWNFGGGPGAHGSHFHRQPGSVGNRTWPGRVMPGRRLPGQYGNETLTIPKVSVVDVIPEENVLLVRGSVPGARNSLLKLMKV